MTKNAIEIRSHQESTATNLQAAEDLLKNGQYESAAAHAAESAFHAASALLLDEEIEASRHGDVITLTHQIFVNGRRLTKEQGAELSWLFDLRRAEEKQEPVEIGSEEG